MGHPATRNQKLDTGNSPTVDTQTRNTALLGLLLALGLIIGGWTLGAEIKATRLSDRYVTVRGVLEREVKSDLATCALSYKEAGDDLSLVYGNTKGDKNAILH